MDHLKVRPVTALAAQVLVGQPVVPFTGACNSAPAVSHWTFSLGMVGLLLGKKGAYGDDVRQTDVKRILGQLYLFSEDDAVSGR